MTDQQAQKILILYRPGTADVQDADVAEALKLVKTNLDLARWFETHCANYQTFRGALKQIAVPAALKEQILAECAAQKNVVTLPSALWRKHFLAIAAMIILLIGVVIFWLRPGAQASYSAYRNRMVSAALRLYSMDMETNNPIEIRHFLAAKNAPADYAVPKGFNRFQFAGCAIVRWQNQPVSMLCFRTGRPLAAGEKSDLYLFVATNDTLPKAHLPEIPQVQRVNQTVTASWSENGKIYLLTTRADEKFLRKILGLKLM